MGLGSIYSDIQGFLSIPNEVFSLEFHINRNFSSENQRMEILSKIRSFVYHFSLFKDVKPFMNSVYQCIVDTLDMRIESITDFEELLIKNALMRFIQEYVNYSKLTHKRQTLKLFSDSLEKLQLQPLIINLGLFLKPMYQDINYLNSLNTVEEVEVNYSLNNEYEMKIKSHIDQWLKSQVLDLDNHINTEMSLVKEFNSCANSFNISEDQELYERLLTEAKEMLSMRLTMMSLMDSLSDDHSEPLLIR